MREHQIVISLKPEQFQEVQKQARAAGAQSVGAFVRQNLLLFLGLDESDNSKKSSQMSPAVQADPDWKFIAGELRRLHSELKVLSNEATVSTTLLTEISGSSKSGPQLASSVGLAEPSEFSKPYSAADSQNQDFGNYMQPAAKENFLTDGAPVAPDEYLENYEESLILPPAQNISGPSTGMPFQFQSPSIPMRSPYGLPISTGQIPLSSPFSQHSFMPGITPLTPDLGNVSSASLETPVSELPAQDVAGDVSNPDAATPQTNVPTPVSVPLPLPTLPVSPGGTHEQNSAIFDPDVEEVNPFYEAAARAAAGLPPTALPQVSPPSTQNAPPAPAKLEPEPQVSPQPPVQAPAVQLSPTQAIAAQIPAPDATINASHPQPKPVSPPQTDSTKPGAFAPQKDDMEVLADRAFAISPRLGAIEPEVAMQPAPARSFADTLEELLDAGLINQVMSQPVAEVYEEEVEVEADSSSEVSGDVEAPPDDYDSGGGVQVSIREVDVPSASAESAAASDNATSSAGGDDDDAQRNSARQEVAPTPHPYSNQDQDDKDQPPKPPPRRRKLM